MPGDAAFWITGCAVFVCWNLGTLIGALAGEAIDPETLRSRRRLPGRLRRHARAPSADARRAALVAIVGALICLVHGPVRCRSACRSCAPRRRCSSELPGAMTWTLVLAARGRAPTRSRCSD